MNVRRCHYRSGNASDGAVTHSLEHGTLDCMKYIVVRGNIADTHERERLERRLIGFLFSEKPNGANDNYFFRWNDIT